jgi:MFS family permease
VTINAYERRLLLLLGAASFFGRYDETLLGLLLVQIQADLAIPEAQLGLLGSIVRLGALPAFAALLLADRVGRRRVLLATIAGYTVCTAATALARSFEALVVFQFLARGFLTAELLLAMVVVVEEFRPENRGVGVGLLGTLALLGNGLAMILFGAVEVLPFGWRGLYAVGLIPLLAIGLLRRSLAETRRFEAVQNARGGQAVSSWIEPLRILARRHPGRLAAVCLFGLLWSFSNAPVDFFLAKHFQDVHGWAPARFATVAVLGGALGLTGQVIAGRISDRSGRRPALLFFTTMEPLLGIVLYLLLGPVVMGVYVTWVFASVANDVVGRAAGQEMFPTRARATAAGAATLVMTLGGVLGLACESLLFAAVGSHATAIPIIAAVGFLMPLVVWLAYPETSGRTLEEISPDSRLGSAGDLVRRAAVAPVDRPDPLEGGVGRERLALLQDVLGEQLERRRVLELLRQHERRE